MGGLLTLNSFVTTFPQIDTTKAGELGLNAAEKSNRSTVQGMILYPLTQVHLLIDQVSLLPHTTWVVSVVPFSASGLVTISAAAELSSLVRLSWLLELLFKPVLTRCRI